MARQIDKEVFGELRDRVLDALRPLLTPAEILAISDQCAAKEDGLYLEGSPLDDLYIIEDRDMDDPTLRIEDIYVEEAHQGRGIGRSIIKATIDFAQENDFDVNLSAHPDLDFEDPGWDQAKRRLIAYYESFGMSDDGAGNMEIRQTRPAPGPGM